MLHPNLPDQWKKTKEKKFQLQVPESNQTYTVSKGNHPELPLGYLEYLCFPSFGFSNWTVPVIRQNHRFSWVAHLASTLAALSSIDMLIILLSSGNLKSISPRNGSSEQKKRKLPRFFWFTWMWAQRNEHVWNQPTPNTKIAIVAMWAMSSQNC